MWCFNSTFITVHMLVWYEQDFLFSSRSEVSSSSSSESPGQSGRQLSIQALLHSQSLQASGKQDQQDCEILSSQEDMFDADRTGKYMHMWHTWVHEE